MSCYPDPIAANEPQGPSLVSLRMQYFEEHGFMPAPELDRELLDKYWEGIPRGQEGIIQPPAPRYEQAEQPLGRCEEQQQQQHYVPVETSDNGHAELVQRRLDLAPFFGPSPAEIHGGPLGVPRSGLVTGPASPSPIVSYMPYMPTQLAESSHDLAASAPRYGDQFFSSAAPVSAGDSTTKHPALVPNQGSSMARSSYTGAHLASPTPQAAITVGRPRRSCKTKDQWTQTEIDRVVYLREKENKNWAEIHEDLGTHTAGSIADKYWQAVRLSKGLKK